MPDRSPRLIAALALAAVVTACAGTGTTPGTASPSASASSMPHESPSDGAPSNGAPSNGAGADVVVTAVDFGYEGMPDSVASGTTLGLTNAGQEVHEIVVVRRNEGVSQSFEELLALPQEEVIGFVTDVGFAFAEPGTTAADTVTLDTPGDYLMVCFIPAGTTSLPSMDPAASAPPSLGTGAPHFTLGMQKSFTVAG